MDKNNDGLVSLEEFLKYTKSSEFTDDEPWQSVVEEDNFKQDEFDKYEVRSDYTLGCFKLLCMQYSTNQINLIDLLCTDV